MSLSPAQQRFILHWGEMGTRWGINRSMAQIHALLYLAPEPLPAEAIADTLELARSNVSNSLRELQGWGIVRLVHRLGDRRDHFQTLADPWELLRTILRQRKRREIDPTIEVLRDCLAAAGPEEGDAVRGRIGALLDLFERASTWYGALDRLPTAALVRFVRMGDKLPRKLGLAPARPPQGGRDSDVG